MITNYYLFALLVILALIPILLWYINRPSQRLTNIGRRNHDSKIIYYFLGILIGILFFLTQR